MNSTSARPLRYVNLVQNLDGKRRTPVIPGSWVVVTADEDLAGAPGITLAKAVEGPSYTHVDGHCVQAVWRLHDGREIPQLRLTAVEISELLESATDALRWLRNGVHPDRIPAEMLRAHRAGSLARRALEADGDPGISRLTEDDRCALRAMSAVSGAIAELEISWREMVRSRLPNLVRSLWLAGALEISRRAGGDLTAGVCEISGISPEISPGAAWEPNTEGRPHPVIAGLSATDLAAIGWRS